MQLYNHTRKLFLNQEVDMTALKVMLLDDTYTFDATEEDMTAATSAEVDGNGWATGGPTLANNAVTVVNTNGAMLDVDDVSVTADGGTIGPADAHVIYDSANGFPLFHFAFAEPQSAGDGTPFNINIAATGIYVVSEPA